jgi:hypothetical protein
MSAFGLDFLNTLSAEEVVAPQPKTVKKDRNPDENFMGIRLFKDGSVYPSKALVEKYNLEYQKPVITQEARMKDGQPVLDDNQQPIMDQKKDFSNDNSYGFDIVDSAKWAQVAKSWGNNQRLVLAGVTFKKAGKVDLFASCRFDEAGKPIGSVLDQGSSTYGKAELLPMIGEIYGVQCGANGYMDLELVEAHNLKGIAPNGIFNIPKTIARGTKQGAADIVRRENMDIFPLMPIMDTTLPLGTEEAPKTETTLAEATAIPVPSQNGQEIQA